MKRYNLSKIMKSAHQIKKYMKLYGLTTWAECLKQAWASEKKRIAKEEAEEAEKQAMKADLARPCVRSIYDNLSIPQSAYYNPYSYGHLGAHYVGD
jgi:hypothetical protein